MRDSSLGIKTITFDVGGTLAEGNLNRERYQLQLLEYLQGIRRSITAKDFHKNMGAMLGKLGAIRKKNLEANFSEFYSEFLFRLGIEPDPDVLESIRGIYHENFPQIEIQGVRELLEALVGRFKLGVISNTMTGVSRVILNKSGLSKFFDVVVLSCDIGVRKPSPKIFLHTLEMLGSKPSEAIHIGDSMEHDVVGAKNARMKVVWIKQQGVEILHDPDFIISSVTELPEVIRHWQG